MKNFNPDLVTSNTLASLSGVSHLVSFFCFLVSLVGALVFMRKERVGFLGKFFLLAIVFLFSAASLMHGGKTYEGDIVLYGWSPLFSFIFEGITAIAGYVKSNLYETYAGIGFLFAPYTTSNIIRFQTGLSFAYGLTTAISFLVYYSCPRIVIRIYSGLVFNVGEGLKRSFASVRRRIGRSRNRAETGPAGVEGRVMEKQAQEREGTKP